MRRRIRRRGPVGRAVLAPAVALAVVTGGLVAGSGRRPASANSSYWTISVSNQYGSCVEHVSHFRNLYGYAIGRTGPSPGTRCWGKYARVFFPYPTGTGWASGPTYAYDVVAVSPYQAEPDYSEHDICTGVFACRGTYGLW
ncbi:MAG: hypothetical protein M5U14_16315 [Acidimicrobiia bacterium]|nr:hypothetical protein [Acidimicrobiia bacterium]